MDRQSETPRAAALRKLLASRGIHEPRVLATIGRPPREDFVPERLRDQAYEDVALPIESGQTISQPFIVAKMTELLHLKGVPGETVLEIGTGSGYQTAILAQLADRVVSIERLPELQAGARSRLTRYHNIEFHVGDGSLGWPEGAPYDAILVAAAAPAIAPLLYRQLKIGGRLVLPVGNEKNQVLTCIERTKEQPIVTEDCHCRFVPLIGEGGWKPVPE
jgi:protein-L-isoaspartate(D-aspartate) O-methyltransferase